MKITIAKLSIHMHSSVTEFSMNFQYYDDGIPAIHSYWIKSSSSVYRSFIKIENFLTAWSEHDLCCNSVSRSMFCVYLAEIQKKNSNFF